MGKDDFGNPPQDQVSDNDSFYDDAVPQESDELLEENPEQWEQPTDDFVEEEETTEAEVEAAPAEEDDMYAEGPVEEDYVQQVAEEQDDYGAHEGEDAPGAKKQNDKKAGFGFGKKQAADAGTTMGAAQPSAIARFLPYIGAGVAALVLGFLGFQQFSSSFSETQPASPLLADANQAQQQPAADQFPAAQQPAQAENKGWDAMPSGQQQAQNNTPPQDNQAAQMLGLAPAPTPTEQPAAQPAAQIDTSAQQQVNAPTPAPSATTEMENRIAALTQQIEQMRATQTDLEQKLQAAQAAPPAEDSAKKALEERIAQLEQKLTQASAASSESSSASDAPAPRRSSRSAKNSVSSTDFVASKTKRSRKAATRKRDLEGDVENAGTLNAGSWVLRSATPGAAWLSQGPYSSDLRRVVPGDKVPGLGTITSVRQVAGRWLVEGTQGSVR